MKTEEHIDPGSLAAVLAADYPLIDQPLILAILSDYPSSELKSKLPEIKDQLGILEATLVPDPDIPSEFAESWAGTESTSQSGIDDLSNRLGSLNTTSTNVNGSTSTGATTWSESDGTEEYGDEVDLLKSLFPSTPESELSSVLHSYPILQDAIDHLLSLELIRHVEEEGHWPEDEQDIKVLSEPEPESAVEEWETTQSKRSTARSKSKSKPSSKASSKPPSIESSPIVTSTPNYDNIAFPLPSGSHSRSSTNGDSISGPDPVSTKKSKKKKDTITIPLVDTLQRKHTPTPSARSRTSTAPTSRSSSPSRFEIRSVSANNPWHTVTSLSSYLSDLLSQPSTHFSSHLHSPNYHSTYSAVLASLAKLPAHPTKTDSSSRMILEDIYASMFEDREEGLMKRDLEICVHAAGEDIATVMDLMDLLKDISDWSSDDHDGNNDGFSDPTGQPDYKINTDSTPLPSTSKPQTVTLNLPPVQAIDMARSTSATSTISNKSVDEIPHPPSKSGLGLPGKMTRPEKKVRPTKVKEEPLFGGAIREAKIREVPGSKTSLSSLNSPMVLDAHEIFSPIGSAPSSPKLGNRQLGGNGKQVHPQNWRTVTNSIPHSRSQSTSSSRPERKMTYEECMANAQLERVRRETVIRAAGRNFRPNVNGVAGGGRAVKGVIAGHYASQAMDAAKRARDWELKAARLRVNSQLQTQLQPQTSDTHTASHNHNYVERGRGGGVGGRNQSIDLHNLTINEALTIANEQLDQWWKVEKERRLERWKITEQGRFIIITGVGRHSVNNKGVLGPAVSNDLERKGWKVDRGDSERGYLVVRGR
ncbi:hypothetical protein L486_07491 [Kwoniella mangroviensis CBS 10435]|uniref:Smr domain-containing protein n=1 Tax=Kwoniella mangroviensis CBS 10435 TaxID=1331196 RepID=A0A1B9IGW1_9TREE|nr:uncharacterized protein I203_03313 [Kwoniella mangroviensis CBS 8507]OCF54836.1 hypothetical protein L486_07491 [Kwoniella mangroviensis CBS 10435]OCF67616.1 hypothetical protein I203_03313 [Kwoniella mangroviensis CBS 8507]